MRASSAVLFGWKQRLSWYGNAEEETYAYAQPTYTSYDRSYEQSYGVSDETTWFPNQSYQEVCKEEEYQHQVPIVHE
jgi:hypothetical protein